MTAVRCGAPEIYYSLDADDRPEDVPVGSLLYVTDTQTTYVYDGADWIEVPAGTPGFSIGSL